MKKETDCKLFDVRLVQKHICDGLITLKEYEKHLGSLEDSGQNAEEINLEDFVDTEELDQQDDPQAPSDPESDQLNSESEITL